MFQRQLSELSVIQSLWLRIISQRKKRPYLPKVGKKVAAGTSQIFEVLFWGRFSNDFIFYFWQKTTVIDSDVNRRINFDIFKSNYLRMHLELSPEFNLDLRQTWKESETTNRERESSCQEVELNLIVCSDFIKINCDFKRCKPRRRRRKSANKKQTNTNLVHCNAVNIPTTPRSSSSTPTSSDFRV